MVLPTFTGVSPEIPCAIIFKQCISGYCIATVAGNVVTPYFRCKMMTPHSIMMVQLNTKYV